MPKELNSNVEVVAYVSRTRGGIAYVSGAAGTEGVTVLAVYEERRPERTVALLGGNPILAETATKAARQWVYSPGPS
jgi:hypothetical protein